MRSPRARRWKAVCEALRGYPFRVGRGEGRKHAISFAEASTLFTCGVDYLEIFDAEHSLEEERFICIGPITRGIVVIVTVDVDTDVIRIISARRATRRESRLCEQYLEERSHGRRPS